MGSVWSVHIYRRGSVWSAVRAWSAGSVWSTWVESVWSVWYARLNQDAVCTICGIWMICRISVWSGGSVKSGYFSLVFIMFSRDGVCMGYIFHTCVPEWELARFLQDLKVLWNLDSSHLFTSCSAEMGSVWGTVDISHVCTWVGTWICVICPYV